MKVEKPEEAKKREEAKLPHSDEEVEEAVLTLMAELVPIASQVDRSTI